MLVNQDWCTVLTGLANALILTAIILNKLVG